MLESKTRARCNGWRKYKACRPDFPGRGRVRWQAPISPIISPIEKRWQAFVWPDASPDVADGLYSLWPISSCHERLVAAVDDPPRIVETFADLLIPYAWQSLLPQQV